MLAEGSFDDFIRRIRSGDEEAARELVQRYEPVIRLEVRRRLNDPSLYRLFDSVDICQSVLLSFFIRARLGQYDLSEAGQLVRLLIAMARKKLAFQARKQHSQRRDSRRQVAEGGRLLETVTDGPGPDSLAIARDLLTALRQRLTSQEIQLAELREQGLTWPEIAFQVGGTPQARRRQLERALDRVASQVGLDDE
jgi:RNA polymerase sigma-70 factor (ECF subfamily)